MPADQFIVGEYRVDPEINALRSGDAEIQLEPKVMALLLYLAGNAGSTLSREQLFNAVWPGVVVSDDTLTQAVIKLRKALGDDARNPRYIQTVPKRGYRFCAPVTAAADQAPVPPERGRRSSFPIVLGALVLLGALGAGLLLTDWGDQQLPEQPQPGNLAPDGPPSLTVRSFRLLGADESQMYLAQGLTYDLITDLSKLSGLTVIGPRTIMGLGTDQTDAPAARYLVQGEVQRIRDQIRVHVHLFDAHSGQQIWSERYHRPVGNIFQLQEAISQKIVSSLSIKLNEQERRRLASRYTPNVQAYELFLRAQSLLLVRQSAENTQARQLFRQAIDLDPSFARAYGGLALSFAADFRNQWTSDGPAALERARTMARTALEIDPEIPEVYWVLAYVSTQQRQHEDAIALLRKAISLDPSFADAYALMGGINTYVGRPEETLGAIRTAIKLNPDAGYLYYLLLGRAYFFLGDWEQARINLHEALARNPSNLEARVYRAAVLESSGDHDGAAWEAEEILALDANFVARDWLKTYPMTDPHQAAQLLSVLKNLGL
ncbi:MAG: winged helix-turn-helix domain-containing protein [Chromatiaceae bacterium]|nr:winged helix-turn-helix domain-containing protein [Chromatiaceae bacterium]